MGTRSRFSSAGMPSIFVRTLNGSVAVPQEGSVSELKQEIEARAGVAADCVRLAYNGHILQDDELLEDLESKITLELNFELVGGGKKRKKKEYTQQCGAGTFMAMHFNRHYCGKCHLTYMLENPGRDPALDKKKDAAAPAAAAAAAAPAKGKKKK